MNVNVRRVQVEFAIDGNHFRATFFPTQQEVTVETLTDNDWKVGALGQRKEGVVVVRPVGTLLGAGVLQTLEVVLSDTNKLIDNPQHTI